MTFASFLSGPGDDSYSVPLELFRENRRKLADRLQIRLGQQQTTPSTPSDSNSNNNNDDDDKEDKDENFNETKRHIVVLKGGTSSNRYDTDFEEVFRQESYFWWLTGVKEPDCALVMVVDNDRSDRGDRDRNSISNNHRYALFVPRLPASYATIMGKIRSLDEWKELYGVDGGVYFDDTLEDFVEAQLQMCYQPKVLLMRGPNTDSGVMYEALMPSFSRPSLATPEAEPKHKSDADIVVDTTILFPILADCRVCKSDFELALLEHVTMITSFAHAYVMRNVRPGMAEYQCESLFKHYAYYNYGSRLVSYTSICGCGPNAAVLHYGHVGEPNASRIEADDNCLFDMGAEYQCYASDVTCSFPANGRFTEKYKAVYESVLNAQRAVYAMMEPGVSWVDCHIAAELEIVKGLYAIGVVQLPKDYETETGDAVRELERLVKDHRLGAVFMPHGLGHLLGIDAHDVGGYLEGTTPPRSTEAGLRCLRTARVLEENIVLTVEPGCYFIDHLLDEAMEEGHPLAPFLNKELIDKEYRGYGGVRLEDVLVITAKTPRDNDATNNKNNSGSGSGYSCVRNFTLCPRTVREVEGVMAGGKWPPTVDEAPELRRLLLTKPWSLSPPPPSK